MRNGSEPISRAPIVRGSGDGAVYLTFDDGPDPEWTVRVLDVLAAAVSKRRLKAEIEAE